MEDRATLNNRALDAATKVVYVLGKSNSDIVTIAAVAESSGVSPWYIELAGRLLKAATPEELELVRSGGISLAKMDRDIRARKKGVVHQQPNGLNATARRIETVLAKSQLWSDLKTGLDALTSLPQPRDVIGAVYGKRRDTVDTKLPLAIAWLKEFENEWNARKGNADADQSVNQDDAGDAGASDIAAGTQYTEPSAE